MILQNAQCKFIIGQSNMQLNVGFLKDQVLEETVRQPVRYNNTEMFMLGDEQSDELCFGSEAVLKIAHHNDVMLAHRIMAPFLFN